MKKTLEDMKSVFERWAEGLITDDEAIRELYLYFGSCPEINKLLNSEQTGDIK